MEVIDIFYVNVLFPISVIKSEARKTVYSNDLFYQAVAILLPSRREPGIAYDGFIT